MTGHARLAPSAAERWMTCPASPDREALYPDTTSEAADWGTASHAILERSVLQMTHPLDVYIDDLYVEDEGAWAPSYRIIDRWSANDLIEMRACAAEAYDYALLRGDLTAETRVNPGTAIGRGDIYGDADIQIRAGNILEVVDLKTGKGVVVEPDTPQLKIYGAGALLEVLEREGEVIDTVILTIVQPRAPHSKGPIRSIEMTPVQLLSWLRSDLYQAAIRTDNPKAPAVPSEAGCRFCKVKQNRECQEYLQRGEDAIMGMVPGEDVVTLEEVVNAALRTPAASLTSEQIARVLEAEPIIAGWLKDLRSEGYKRLKDGQTVPHFKLVTGRSSRKWIGEPDELFTRFRGFTKVEDGKKKKLTRSDLFVESFISPAQAEKVLKPVLGARGWKLMKESIASVPGALTMVHESDPRKPVNKDYGSQLQANPEAGSPAEDPIDLSFLD